MSKVRPVIAGGRYELGIGQRPDGQVTSYNGIVALLKVFCNTFFQKTLTNFLLHAMLPAMTIQDKIKAHIQANNISLPQFSNESGIPHGTLNGIVHESKQPGLTTIRLLVKAMQCSYDYLLDDSIETDSHKAKDQLWIAYSRLSPYIRRIVNAMMSEDSTL